MFIPSLRQSPAAQSQTGSEKQRTATVSGRVILNGKPLGGVTVQFLPDQMPVQAGRVEPLQDVADEQGRYQITGIPAGSYLVNIKPDEFVIVGGLHYLIQRKLINVLEGEKVEQFDLVLKRGGVITGRVSDASGRPIAGEEIKLTRISDDGKRQLSSHNTARMTMTDEQGIYRVFPLPEGRYLVSARMTLATRIGTQLPRNVYYPQTYHPGVSDQSSASAVEVSEGAETAGVDILIAETMKTYEIKGRVVNAETGNAVEGIHISCNWQRKADDAVESGSQSVRSNAEGEFQCHGLLPGKYTIYPKFGDASKYFGDPAHCEITESSVDGVEVKLRPGGLRPGGSVSGKVIFEGANDPPLPLSAQANPSLFLIWKSSEDSQTAVSSKKHASVNVKTDGSFRIAGLQPGKIYFSPGLSPITGGFWIKRVELGGTIIPDGLEIGPGENLSNVRVIVCYSSLRLGGEVKIIGGDLPPNMGIYVSLHRLNKSEYDPQMGADADTRRRFVFSNLIPGEYEVRMVAVNTQVGKPLDTAISKLILNTRQTVSIGGAGSGSESGEATVTLVIDLSQKKGN
jgi:protocatechuate 3,4-dioxygenase beta subunit